MNRAIFLDRDNTIVANDGDLGDPSRIKLIQGAASAIASMRGLGYKIAVVTNQGGVARGVFNERDVEAVHARLAEILHQQANGAKVERFYYCPFHPDGTVPGYRREHPWRKPQPGMLLQGAEDLDLDLAMCWMVGDQLRDVEAGVAAGVRTILLADEDRARALKAEATVQPDFVARNLIEAARIIAQHPKQTPATAEKSTADRPASSPAPSPRQTFAANEKLGTSKHTGSTGPRKQRPFKPWDVQPTDYPIDREQTVTAPKQPATPAKQSSTPPKPAPAPAPVTPAKPAPAPAPPAAEKKTAKPISPQPVVTAGDTTDDDDQSTTAGSTDRLLNQVLRQLKRGEADHSPWSAFKLLGLGILQPLVVCAVVAGLFMAKDSAGTLTWLAGAALGQAAVATLLILHGQRQ